MRLFVRSRGLLGEIGQVIGWDLGSYATSSDEIEEIRQARASLERIEMLFCAGNTRVSFQIREAVREPMEAITISADDSVQLKAHLEKVEEILSYDYGFRADEDRQLFLRARASLKELKQLLNEG